MRQILILSDGRMGHVNQSIAFAKYLGVSYDVVEVRFKNKLCKMLSYLLDNIGVRTKVLFSATVDKTYDVVVGTGSSTYYATKVLANSMKAKSVVMMLPKGYSLDFDSIFVQSHDKLPKQDNIIEIPVNFSYAEPQKIYQAQKKSIGIVIGGDNKVFAMLVDELKKQLDYIVKEYAGYEIAITTSPRTNDDIERLVESYGFAYEVIFSKNPINPIPDFLQLCETVFITGDSTSMISEAVSYGKSNVVVLPLESKGENKFTTFITALEKEGYLHIFDGTIQPRNKKIDFASYIQKVML